MVSMSCQGLEEVSANMCPTTGMDRVRATRSIIAAVTVGKARTAHRWLGGWPKSLTVAIPRWTRLAGNAYISLTTRAHNVLYKCLPKKGCAAIQCPKDPSFGQAPNRQLSPATRSRGSRRNWQRCHLKHPYKPKVPWLRYAERSRWAHTSHVCRSPVVEIEGERRTSQPSRRFQPCQVVCKVLILPLHRLRLSIKTLSNSLMVLNADLFRTSGALREEIDHRSQFPSLREETFGSL